MCMLPHLSLLHRLIITEAQYAAFGAFICVLCWQCMFVTTRQRSFAFEAKTSLTLICLRVSIAITEHHFHKRLGKERVYFAAYSPPSREVRAGAWRQVLKQRSQRSSADCLSQPAFFQHPGPQTRAAPAMASWTPSCQSSIKKNVRQVCLSSELLSYQMILAYVSLT